MSTDTTVCRFCGSPIEFEANQITYLKPSICKSCMDALNRQANDDCRQRELKARGIPPRYRGATFDSFRPVTPSQQAALEAARDHAGEGVMLLGKAGCGKTHLACAAIMAGPDGSLFANTAELLDDVRRGFDGAGSRLFERALRSPLLALDDLGAEAVTDWVRDRLYTLINHRWDHCLPLIVTTNVKAADLAARIGQGVASRIAGCCARRIEVQGPDGRREPQ